MWNFELLCLALLGMSHAAHSGVGTSGSGFAGASSSAGGGGYGGYGGSYGSAFPFVPIPSFDNRFGGGGAGNVADLLQNLQSQQAGSLSMTSTQDDATAYASSTLSRDDLFQQQLQHQAALFNTIQDRFGETGGTTVTHGSGNGGNYAAASASYGPGGGHQSVFISPPNPKVPNIHTRFDTSGTPGSVGISSSSFSSSSDVNGVKTNRRVAATSVNDNGKVTTYYTHS